ncbi:MAG: hypothetical protein AAGI23_19305 [Bacteroidota bacterium]
MTWTQSCEDLVGIIFSCPFSKRNIFKDRLHRYISELHPDVLIDAYLDRTETEADEMTFYRSALLALDDKERIQVLQFCIKDLSMVFPDEMLQLEQFVEVEAQNHHNYFHHRKERLDKLNRYLKRIDGLINSGRYTLALGLANRCLREYYSHFLRHTMKYNPTKTPNMNQMAIQIYRYILRYFRTNNIPYSATRLLFITIVTNALFIAVTSNAYVDKALATYARDNLNSIVRFMIRYS